jgi:DtxR family Mn-dependent transcriptional regulator
VNTARRDHGDAVTPAMEDYLKAIHRMTAEAAPVTTHALAERLGVAGPSVTKMVKRLHELGHVDHARYHGVTLTVSGERIAVEVIRHHRLLERYLVEKLGYPADQVHAEAERLEHYLSEDLESYLDAALGHPTVGPHGDPIPRADPSRPASARPYDRHRSGTTTGSDDATADH